MGDFIAGIKGFLGDTWSLISDIIDFVKSIYDLILGFMNFIPSSFRGILLVIVGIVLALMIWRLKK